MQGKGKGVLDSRSPYPVSIQSESLEGYAREKKGCITFCDRGVWCQEGRNVIKLYDSEWPV